MKKIYIALKDVLVDIFSSVPKEVYSFLWGVIAFILLFLGIILSLKFMIDGQDILVIITIIAEVTLLIYLREQME